MVLNKFLRGAHVAGLLPLLASAALLAPASPAAAQSIAPPTECDETTGMAGAFACEDVDLLAIVPSFELSQELCELLNPLENPLNPTLGGDQPPVPMTGSDMWGWSHTDADGNVREFAVQGLSDAVAFIEMTDPVNPKRRASKIVTRA